MKKLIVLLALFMSAFCYADIPFTEEGITRHISEAMQPAKVYSLTKEEARNLGFRWANAYHVRGVIVVTGQPQAIDQSDVLATWWNLEGSLAAIQNILIMNEDINSFAFVEGKDGSYSCLYREKATTPTITKEILDSYYVRVLKCVEMSRVKLKL